MKKLTFAGLATAIHFVTSFWHLLHVIGLQSCFFICFIWANLLYLIWTKFKNFRVNHMPHTVYGIPYAAYGMLKNPAYE